ncbi:translation initiation factor eIF-2B [candidate division KSB1 bacterium]|nr:translation initiation factor eIF-2B [candidate division KSB1 bacterium]NIR68401.1 translation initiation factor eIF-2B [candidate division KSB1 bacterium]NIS22475.1 translation initiation factor eIF-2B [candidate division KSB1 bacterium]NIT69323.1 translation initiation factor eIF-2B [candidate division KSB1 bacterium]NIU22980.1 translation initiation factor eIF-2B [candidate division KSB1 bacterium]
MSENYVEKLEEVKHDHTSGAWVVAQKAIDCLEALAKEKSNVEYSELIAEVERVIGEILKAQPNMSQLTNLFNALLFTVEQETSNDPVVLCRKIVGEATRFEEHTRNAVKKVAKFGAELIANDSVILTHSNSSTVLEIIKKAHEDGKAFQVILSESRPVCEGRERAKELSKLGIPTLYLIDAAICMGIEQADIVMLGADSVSENALVNKIGTKAICLMAREAVVPCYAACESSKFMPKKLVPKKEPVRDPKQVWDNPPSETTIENYYFDETPLELFTGIITEEGVLTPTELGSKIRAHKMNPKLIQMLK